MPLGSRRPVRSPEQRHPLLVIAAFDPATGIGRRAEIVPGDAQSEPDIAANLARQWFDTDGVQAIADVPNAAIALAVQTVARDRRKITLISAAASVDLYGKGCSPTGFLWTYDTAALSRGTAQAVFDAQGRSWYFITADFSFAIQMKRVP